MTMQEVLDSVGPEEVFCWAEWKQLFGFHNVDIRHKDTVSPSAASLNKTQLKEMLMLESVTIVPVGMQGPTIVFEPPVIQEPEIELSVEEWRAEFELLMRSRPEAGDLLVTSDGKPVKLSIELYAGKAPFIFGRVYIPQIVGKKLGWFVQSIEERSSYGWKAILVPRSRDAVIKRFGIGQSLAQVKNLIVVRESNSGGSLLVEVNEW